ncbi:MAG: zinc ABC transporter substrate-binding protein, partial [Phycisphaerae bacterium]|nr:zinc ABC transporter substrate-binding protein [Phycisphaerae bacterium]
SNDDAWRTCTKLKKATWLWLLMMLLVVGACRRSTDTTGPGEGPIRVFVSIPPQKHFVQRVGGERVQVSVLLPPGQSPATYELAPKQMVELAAAQTYFRIGVPFEKQVVVKIGAMLRNLPIVDLRKGIELRPLSHDPNHHGDYQGHSHTPGEPDPHSWMNPRLVKKQAQTICAELCRLDPDHREHYERNCRAFEADLDRADAEIAAALAPLRGREFFVFHPAYGYFADAYELRQVAIESGGKQPTAKQLADLIKRAKQANVKLIFVQPQFDRSNAEVIAREIGGAVVAIDPLAEDYIDNLLNKAAVVKRALADAPTTAPSADPGAAVSEGSADGG